MIYIPGIFGDTLGDSVVNPNKLNGTPDVLNPFSFFTNAPPTGAGIIISTSFRSSLLFSNSKTSPSMLCFLTEPMCASIFRAAKSAHTSSIFKSLRAFVSSAEVATLYNIG